MELGGKYLGDASQDLNDHPGRLLDMPGRIAFKRQSNLHTPISKCSNWHIHMDGSKFKLCSVN